MPSPCAQEASGRMPSPMSSEEERDLEAEARDAAHWSSIEQASETLLDGKLEEGLRALRDIIEGDPSNPYAFHFLGAALFDLKKFEAARDAYAAALRLSPSYRASRVGFAHCLRLLGDLQGAIDAATEVLSANNEDSDAIYVMGLTLAAAGQRDQARLFFERFLTTHPELEAQMEVRGILDALDQTEEGSSLEWET